MAVNGQLSLTTDIEQLSAKYVVKDVLDVPTTIKSYCTMFDISLTQNCGLTQLIVTLNLDKYVQCVRHFSYSTVLVR